MYYGVQEEETQAETKMNLARVVICFLTQMRFLTLEKCLLLSEPPQDSSEEDPKSHAQCVLTAAYR